MALGHSIFEFMGTLLAVSAGLYIRHRYGRRGYLLYLTSWMVLLVALIVTWKFIVRS
jgi:hypothetical protein